MINCNKKIAIKVVPTKRVILKWFLSAVIVFISFNTSAATILAEIVWVEYVDQQHHLYFSRYDGESWIDAVEPIYSSDQALTGPTLGTDSSGHKILIWTEQLKLKTVLMSMTTVDKDGAYDTQLDWAEPLLFSDYGVENFAPSIVFDNKEAAWVFWSASKYGADSNIVLSKKSSMTWSVPETVNKSNDVPDFSPMAGKDQAGNIVVKWTTYDSKLGTYTLDSKVYFIENPATLKIENELSLENIRLPDFLPTNQRILVHFPTNKVNQLIPVQGLP